MRFTDFFVTLVHIAGERHAAHRRTGSVARNRTGGMAEPGTTGFMTHGQTMNAVISANSAPGMIRIAKISARIPNTMIRAILYRVKRCPQA